MKLRGSSSRNRPERSRSAETTPEISRPAWLSSPPEPEKDGMAIGSGSILPLVMSIRSSARAGANANGTAAAKQRHGHGLIDQPRWLGGQFVAVEFHQREGIVGIIDRGCEQRVGTLAYQAGVGTVEQDDRTARIGPGEESVDVFSAQRDQDQVPATKNDASRV